VKHYFVAGLDYRPSQASLLSSLYHCQFAIDLEDHRSHSMVSLFCSRGVFAPFALASATPMNLRSITSSAQRRLQSARLGDQQRQLVTAVRLGQAAVGPQQIVHLLSHTVVPMKMAI